MAPRRRFERTTIALGGRRDPLRHFPSLQMRWSRRCNLMFDRAATTARRSPVTIHGPRRYSVHSLEVFHEPRSRDSDARSGARYVGDASPRSLSSSRTRATTRVGATSQTSSSSITAYPWTSTFRKPTIRRSSGVCAALAGLKRPSRFSAARETRSTGRPSMTRQ